MFVKAILATFVLASSAYGLAPPQIQKRDLHNRHAHLGARSPIPLLASADTVKPLGRRHTRTKRCQPRPQTPDVAAAVHVDAVSPAHVEAVSPSPNSDTPVQSNNPAQTEEQSIDTSSSGGRAMTGDGTYYDAGLGACGWVNTNSDYIAAVSHEVFDGYGGFTGTNPNDNPICGTMITATFEGKSVTVKIVDRCGGCINSEDVDFTETAFLHLGAKDRGRLKGIKWTLPNPK